MLLESKLAVSAADSDAHGNARRTGFTVLGLSGITGMVGLVMFALQRGGYIHADPFIGSVGMIALSLVNAVCGLSMLRQRAA